MLFRKGTAVSASDLRLLPVPSASPPRSWRARRPGAKPAGHHRRGHRTGPPRTARDHRGRHRRGAAGVQHARRAELRYAPVPIPNVEALPRPSVAPRSISRLARGYASQADAITRARGWRLGGLVFVRLSMPRPTLQRLVGQPRVPGFDRPRGFANGSLRHCRPGAGPDRCPPGGRADRSPDFDRFAVTRVPTFVLVRDSARRLPAPALVAPADSFLRTSGDVSLDYALEHMRRSAPGFGPPADTFLKRIKG